MIDGFLRGIEADTDKITIIVNDDNYLLSRRILHQSYNFVGQSMESIVNTIRNDLNAIKDT
ncbi:MAG: hypothetical protein LBG52_05725 [Candidatus Peribacteria bacterium]|jgi:hypothetical protein|nr:hypothetical protein [Candidatus Peribacteria bacterium]